MKKAFLFLTGLALIYACRPTEKVWVAIGDSITYLNDHPDETGNRITKGYMTRVAAAIPGTRFINQGHNGWTSGGIADAINQLGIQEADTYTIFLGTNDWWQGRPLGTLNDYLANTGNQTVNGSFRIIIDKLRNLNKKARIILITPMQRVDFVYINDPSNNAYGSYREKNGQTLAQFAAAISDIGRYEKLTVVDLFNKSGMTLKNLVRFKRLKDPANGQYKNFAYPDFIDVPFNPASDDYPYPPEAGDMTYDGLHPSDKGYEVISQMLVKAFKNK